MIAFYIVVRSKTYENTQCGKSKHLLEEFLQESILVHSKLQIIYQWKNWFHGIFVEKYMISTLWRPSHLIVGVLRWRPFFVGLLFYEKGRRLSSFACRLSVESLFRGAWKSVIVVASVGVFCTKSLCKKLRPNQKVAWCARSKSCRKKKKLRERVFL